MKFIEIKEKELRAITLLLIENKIILHPKISPDGIPDFTDYYGKKFTIILDRNILVIMIRLVSEGVLKDDHSLKIVSSLLLWSEFNSIAITSGLALVEYSYHHSGDKESSKENNIFLRIFKQYSPVQWLDLATGKTKSIPIIKLGDEKEFSFFVEGDHYKMHYLEMLKLSQVYFDKNLTIDEKFKQFHNWVFKNILVCRYTTYFVALLLGNRSKMFKKIVVNFDLVNKKCRNTAWDLTYLSLWSTQYYFEDSVNEVYLFATMDKELRYLFSLTHTESTNIYIEIYGDKLGRKITESISGIYTKRDRPNIDSIILDKMILEEQNNLEKLINKNYGMVADME